jgi:EAL domain-containing protein (putative c-di-GMP-specific phosphodiesterase class I)
MASPREHAAPSRESVAAHEDRHRAVLVVEDDAALARVIQRLLRAAGREVVVAHDGKAAADAVVDRPFDVIITDINLPGMSGVDLLRLVRSHDLDVPVILMTGAPSLETAMEALSLGALQYLPKPTSNETLVAAVARASLLHRLARAKRGALELGSGTHLVGDRAGLEAGFERALETMWMAFQPIVGADGRSLFGYEALMRSNEPSLPHPGAVLEAAERLGRLAELGRRVRGLSAASFERAPAGALLFVNLHTRDLLDPALYDPDAPLARFSHRVVLELTERASLDDVGDASARVARLRAAGFRIAIDDLGAGYAGLSSFASLEPEIVKLDMSLVRGVHGSPIRRRLVASMTALCEEMRMQVVAEGIETAEERECIVSLGCGLLQGYLFAKPGPPFPSIVQ